jgi:hypothetical protein
LTARLIYQRLSRVNLYDWFREFVVSYFANFLYKKNFGEYPKGEFEHMSAGIMRGYSDLFNLSSKEEILNFINCQIARLKTGRNNKCYCGSDVKFKFCGFINSPLHRDNVRIPLHVLQSDLLKIMRPSND